MDLCESGEEEAMETLVAANSFLEIDSSDTLSLEQHFCEYMHTLKRDTLLLTYLTARFLDMVVTGQYSSIKSVYALLCSPDLLPIIG